MNDSKKSQNRNPIFDPLVECYGRGALTGLAAFWFGKFRICSSPQPSSFTQCVCFQCLQHHIFFKNH